MDAGADATGWFYREVGGTGPEAQQQYFVLRDESIHCYDARGSSVPQGRLRLANDTQVELGDGPEPGWLGIKCGAKEWRLRCGDPALLRRWRDAVQIASDSSTRKASVERSKRTALGKTVDGVWVPEGMPWAIELCILHLLRPECVREEGLFRLSGSKGQILKLSAQMAAGQRVDLGQCADPAVVCGLLKQLLKDSALPLSQSQGKDLARLLHNRAADEGMAIELRGFISGLRREGRATLHAVVRLLAQVALEPANMMSFSNLGIALGPTLFPAVPMTRCAIAIEMLATHQAAIWPEAPHSSGGAPRAALGAKSPPTDPPQAPSSPLPPATRRVAHF